MIVRRSLTRVRDGETNHKSGAKIAAGRVSSRENEEAELKEGGPA